MFVDARTVPSGATLKADLCIVGAGAAGITLAKTLAGEQIDVLLLESGDLNFRWDAQALYGARNVGLPYFDLDFCQLRYFGGNTNGWAGWCRPLDPIDFEPRPWVEESGWPFSRADLEPYYMRAHEICQLPILDYDPQAWAKRLSHKRARLLPFDPALLEPSIYQFSPPTRFGVVYRDAIGRAANLRCLLNATVVNIAAAYPGAVNHIEVGTLPGGRFRVTARIFVLAAGGIENARLLLLSRDACPAGLGNGHDLVGRYFMEHPHTKRRILVLDRGAQLGLYGLYFYDRRVSARLALPPELQAREGLLNYSANVHPDYWGHGSAGWLALRKLVQSLSRSRLTDPFIRFVPFGRKGLDMSEIWDLLRQIDRATAAALLQLVQPRGAISGYVLETKTEQAPNPDSRVNLQCERDAFGLERAQLDWRTLPIDRRTALRGEELVGLELERLGIGRLELVPRDETEQWPDSLEGGWHQIGTTRMHRDPRRGVVDADCRVHSIANLYVAGGSVFPTGGAAPPTLTVVALALRLADHLKRALNDGHDLPAFEELRTASPVQLPA